MLLRPFECPHCEKNFAAGKKTCFRCGRVKPWLPKSVRYLTTPLFIIGLFFFLFDTFTSTLSFNTNTLPYNETGYTSIGPSSKNYLLVENELAAEPVANSKNTVSFKLGHPVWMTEAELEETGFVSQQPLQQGKLLVTPFVVKTLSDKTYTQKEIQRFRFFMTDGTLKNKNQLEMVFFDSFLTPVNTIEGKKGYLVQTKEVKNPTEIQYIRWQQRGESFFWRTSRYATE